MAIAIGYPRGGVVVEHESSSAVSHGVIATSRDCRELAVYFDFWMSDR